MKNSALSLHIDEPCHEKWSEMTPNEQGRFCSSCRKTVTDFTGLTDNEILETMRTNGSSICGRFYAHQLERKIVHTQLQGKNWKMNSAVTAFFLATGAAAASAQSADTTYHPTVIIDEKHPTGPVCIRTENPEVQPQVHMYTLDAIIMDTLANRPCANARVTVKGTDFSAMTDSTGHVKLSFPDSVAGETVSFEVNVLYHSHGEFTLTAEKVNRTKEVPVALRYIMVAGRVSPRYYKE